MQEETSGGQTTINQYPNNNGWAGGPWGGYAFPAVPAYGYGPGYGYGNPLGGMLSGFGGNINLGGSRGLAATGTALGATALGLVGLGLLGRGGGFFGGPGGPGGPGCDNLVTKDYLGLVKENAALNAVVAQKDAKIYTDDKISDVMKFLIEWRQRQEIVDNTAAAEVAALKAKNAQLEATVGSMLGTYINPQTFAPSQAVFAQMQAAAAAKGGTTPSGN